MIGERLLDTVDQLPRWPELSRTQKAVAVLGAATAAAVLAAGIVLAVTHNTGSRPAESATTQPEQQGIAACSRGTSQNADLPLMQAALGDLTALPHRANLAEIVTNPASTDSSAVALVCTIPGSDVAALEDIGSALAHNIRSAHTASPSVLRVRDIGDGDNVNTTIETSLSAHTFTAEHADPENRAAWRVVASEN